MNIGIDLQSLTSNLRGIYISTKNIVESLLRIDKKNTYIFFNTRGISNTFFTQFKNRKIKLVKGNVTPRLSSELDIYYIPDFFDITRKQIFPSKLKCKTITTLYDMVPALFWNNYLLNYPKKVRNDYILRLGEVEKFDGIITSSLNSKKDVIDILGIKNEKIDVVRLGCSNVFKPKVSEKEFSDVRNKYCIKKKYILCIGGMDHRKNIMGLIESYLMLNKKIREHYQLVIVCKMTKSYKHNILKFYTGNIKQDDVIFTNYIPERDLVVLYSNASLFVFPSFYEGFGLPVLEAMASGCPVVTSNISSIPEITGNAAILVDPYSEESISKAISKVLSDKRLAEKMKRKGIKQASKFSWDNVARKTLEIYKKTAAKKSEENKSICSDGLENKKQKLRLGIVSVWNTRDGIAAYTSFLLEGLSKNIQPVIFAKESRGIIKEDEAKVIRCWDWDDNLDRLYSEIKQESPDIIHFQFNFGYFRFDALFDLLKKLRQMNIRTIITFHSTNDGDSSVKLKEIRRYLKKFDKILVHTKKDLGRLVGLGLDNAEILSQGNHVFKDRDKHKTRNDLFKNSKIISTFGFPFPHKATIELIKALKIVRRNYPDTLLLDLCSLNPDSTHLDIIHNYHDKCRKTATKLGLAGDVMFFTEHIHDYEIIELLQASDIVVMPYKPIKDSASSAVRYAFASQRPVITTDTPIFSEFGKEVYKIKDHSPARIARGIMALFENKKLCSEIVKNAESYTRSNTWKNISKRYEEILKSIA